MLDRQYSRVIRWINRAQSMSADGKYSDAILDVECARAELDDARQELLLCHKNGFERKKICGLGTAVLTGCCMIFFMASPLQMPKPPEVVSAPAEAAVVEESVPAVDGAETAPAVAAAAEEQKIVEEVPAVAEEKMQTDAKADSAYRLSERDVYRLVEVGRKALHGKKTSVVLDFN